MKKNLIFYALVFMISNQTFAQSTCEALLDRAPILLAKKNFSHAYNAITNHIHTMKDRPDFKNTFNELQKPTWETYQIISELINTLDMLQVKQLSHIEKLSLKREFLKENEQYENQLTESLQKPEYQEAYKKHIDANYSFFELLEKINEKTGVKLFPKARLDLTVSNRETILHGEKIVSELNKAFAKDFAEFSGYKSLDDYKNLVKNFDETSKKIEDLLEDHVLVAMHRPENARFWIPLTGFQNQRVTGSSKGSLSPEGRNSAESNLLMANRDEYVKHSVRLMPKYAEVIIGREVTDIQNGQNAKQYGSDLWIMKKSVIEKRATWTPTDSLWPGTSAALNKIDGFIPWSFRSLATPYLYNQIKDSNFFQPGRIFKPLNFNSNKWNSGDHYTEVQIFGDISINDVQALHFRGNPPDAKMVEYLKSKDIEVYDDRNGNLIKYTGEL